MGFRFEYDRTKKILLTTLEGEVTDEVIKELDFAVRRLLGKEIPAIHIVDCSTITKFAMSSEFVRHLAGREPPGSGEPIRRFIVAPSNVGFGMARMFQIAGEGSRADTAVVRSLQEVYDQLGIEPPNLEPLR